MGPNFYWLSILLWVSTLFFIPSLPASETIELTLDAAVPSQRRSSAEKELYAEAIKKATYEKVQELLGAEKLQRYRAVVDRKIIRESGKFVSYMKGGKITYDGSYYRMPVTLRISMGGLQTLLSEAGLTYQKEGAPRALPLISIVDRVHGQSYRWWNTVGETDNSFLRRQTQNLHKSLQNALWSSAFYLLRPVDAGLGAIMPAAYHQESFRSVDYKTLGDLYDVQILLLGEFMLLPSKNLADGVRVTSRISAVHSSTGRIVGEVVRNIETESGEFQEVVSNKLTSAFEGMSEDLAIQVLQTWQRGVLGANLLKVAVRGKMPPQKVEFFKRELARRISAVKTVRERLFEKDQVTFEVDSSQKLSELAASLRRTRWEGFAFRVSDVREDKDLITLELQ
jgi:hypothetical protein